MTSEIEDTRMTSRTHEKTLKERIRDKSIVNDSLHSALVRFAGSAENIDPTVLEEVYLFDAIRRWLVSCRRKKGFSQVEIAIRLNVAQSEVSRIENSFGGSTRLITILNYLNACEVPAEHFFAVMSHGSDEEESAEAVVKDSDMPKSLVIEGKVFDGDEAISILESIHAMNNAMVTMRFSAKDRRQAILGFLVHIRDSHRDVQGASGEDIDASIKAVGDITSNFEARSQVFALIGEDADEEVGLFDNLAESLHLKEF